MPTRPVSHAQRQGRAARDRAYDRTQRQADPRLAEAARIRSSARWQHVRRLKLSHNPICEDIYGTHAAQGRIEIAMQVDHAQSLVQGGAAFDMANLQSLCFACHAKKSSAERRHET